MDKGEGGKTLIHKMWIKNMFFFNPSLSIFVTSSRNFSCVRCMVYLLKLRLQKSLAWKHKDILSSLKKILSVLLNRNFFFQRVFVKLKTLLQFYIKILFSPCFCLKGHWFPEMLEVLWFYVKFFLPVSPQIMNLGMIIYGGIGGQIVILHPHFH